MKNIPRVLWPFLVLAMSACTGLPVEEAANQLATPKSYCAELADLKFEPLHAAARQKVELNSSSPVMEFPQGRSFVAALSLPPGVRTLSIQSIYPEYLPKTSYVDPVIIVLDTNKKELTRYVSLSLRHEKHVIFPALWEWYFGAKVPLPAGAAYVVLYADNKSKRVLQTTSDNGTLWPVPPAPIGTLALIAE